MPSTIEQTISEYFAAIRAMDPERFAATFSPDAESQDPVGTPPLVGRDQIRDFLAGITALFSRVALTEQGVFVCGASAAVKWTGKGTGKNGAEITFEGVDVLDFDAEGRIVKLRAFWDPGPVMAAVTA